MLSKILLVFSLFVVPTHADAALQKFLEETLVAARDKQQLPAVAALIQIDGKLAAEAALGVRAIGHTEPVTIDDRWHIGSCTKAFTVTMIARPVELKLMSFDDTLEELFPAFAKDIDPAYRSITITQLLSHTAGLPPLTKGMELLPLYATINSVTGMKPQRTAIARKYLTTSPGCKPGEVVYLFAQDQLDGTHGHGKLLKAETYRKLHTPVTGKSALGWAAILQPDGIPLGLGHPGGNGDWLANGRIVPKQNMIILLAMNAGNAAAEQAVKNIGKQLQDRLKPVE